MSDPTDTEIRSQESAKWSGIVSGFIGGTVGGIIVNWKGILIIAGLALGAYNHFKEDYDKKWIGIHLDQKQAEIQQIETNTVSQ